MVNLYGPTETTMTKFVYMVEPADQLKKAIPIGKPMRGAKAVVVDKNGGVCPPWRVGELYIRTPYRSLGYFGQPELTNAVFVPNPFNNDAADLVYKTGDLARIVDNGDFEVLGRRDNQVKVRGVRIEIEEIEAALAECEGLSQAAVAVQDDSDGDKRLVAYVVPEAGAQLTAAALRKSLKDKLPEYMLPVAWGMLQKLPLTPTGKVDRQALEKIKPEFMHDGHQGGAPSTQTEEILCGIWAQVLKIDSVVMHANGIDLQYLCPDAAKYLFRLGGWRASLMAIMHEFRLDLFQGLAVHFACGRQRKLLQHAPGYGEHVFRQFVLQALAESGSGKLGASLRHNICNQAFVAVRIILYRNSRLAQSFAFCQCSLNLFYLNADAADFYLIVSSSQDLKIPIVDDSRQVSGLVYKVCGIIIKGVWHKDRVGQLRLAEVSQRAVRSSDIKLSNSPRRTYAAILVYHHGFSASHRFADGNRLLQLISRLNHVHKLCHCGFGWSV